VHYKRVFNVTGSGKHNETVVPADFNMPFFDEVCVRGSGETGKGTQRWMQKPKFYINIGPAYHSGILPTQEQINVVLDVIQNELPRFTDGFINNPVIEQGTNPPAYGTEGYIIVAWHDNMPGTGQHGEWLSNNDLGPEIISGSVDIRTLVTGKRTALAELTQVLGGRCDADSFPKTPSIFCVKEGGTDYYTTLDLQVGKLLYNRPSGARSPDNTT